MKSKTEVIMAFLWFTLAVITMFTGKDIIPASSIGFMLMAMVGLYYINIKLKLDTIISKLGEK